MLATSTTLGGLPWAVESTRRGTLRDGACRELSEETGLVLDPGRLIGPVLRRHATFHFALEMRRQDEEFFIVFLNDDGYGEWGRITG